MKLMMIFAAFAATACSCHPAAGQMQYPEATIPSPQPHSLDQFGAALAIQGDRMVVSARARYVATAPKIYVVNIPSGEIVHEFDEVASDVAFNEDCIVLLSPRVAPDVSRALVYDPETYELLNTIEFESPDILTGTDLAVDGTRIVIGNSWISTHAPRGGRAMVYDALTGQLERELFPDAFHETGYFGSQVDIDGGRIVVGTGGSSQDSDRAGLYVYDAETGELLNVYHPPLIDDGSVRVGGFDLAGGMLAFQYRTYVDYEDFEEIRLVDLEAPEPDFEFVAATQPERNYTMFSFGDAVRLFDGKLLVSGHARYDLSDTSDRVFVYALEDLSLRSTLRGPADVRAFLFFPDELRDGQLYLGRVGVGIEGAVGDGFVEVFTLTDCPQDIDQDGSLGGADAQEFVQGAPDWNDDGAFTFFDIHAYLRDFAAGCP